MTEMSKENWGAGDPYELYVGRWSGNAPHPHAALLFTHFLKAEKQWGNLLRTLTRR